VSFRKIKILAEILGGLLDTSEHFVRKQFSACGDHYSDVASFLKDLGFLRMTKGRASLREDFVRPDDELKDRLVRRLLEDGTPFSTHLKEFLAHFKSTDAGCKVRRTAQPQDHPESL